LRPSDIPRSADTRRRPGGSRHGGEDDLAAALLDFVRRVQTAMEP
jgi:hypothetical protein